MINNKFCLYQVQREIKRNGTTMEFYRRELNEFGEPSDEPVLYCTLKGLYHEHNPHMLDSYKILTGQTLGSYTGDKFPQLMVPYKDFWIEETIVDEETGEEIVIKKNVQKGDEVNFNGRILRVTGVSNVQEWNLLYDISFEEVDDGTATGKNQ